MANNGTHSTLWLETPAKVTFDAIERAKLQALEMVCRRMQAALLLEDRRCMGKRYTQCLDAKQIVDWLVSAGICADRKEAVEMGRMLQKKKFIEHIWGSHTKLAPFRDASMLFRYTDRSKDLLMPTSCKRYLMPGEPAADEWLDADCDATTNHADDLPDLDRHAVSDNVPPHDRHAQHSACQESEGTNGKQTSVPDSKTPQTTDSCDSRVEAGTQIQPRVLGGLPRPPRELPSPPAEEPKSAKGTQKSTVFADEIQEEHGIEIDDSDSEMPGGITRERTRTEILKAALAAENVALEEEMSRLHNTPDSGELKESFIMAQRRTELLQGVLEAAQEIEAAQLTELDDVQSGRPCSLVSVSDGAASLPIQDAVLEKFTPPVRKKKKKPVAAVDLTAERDAANRDLSEQRGRRAAILNAPFSAVFEAEDLTLVNDSQFASSIASAHSGVPPPSSSGAKSLDSPDMENTSPVVTDVMVSESAKLDISTPGVIAGMAPASVHVDTPACGTPNVGVPGSAGIKAIAPTEAVVKTLESAPLAAPTPIDASGEKCTDME